MINPGDAFLGGEQAHGTHHLWIVIYVPKIPTERAVLINVSKRRPNDDSTCILKPGEHPFIKTDSYVRYQSATTPTLHQLQQAVQSGLLTRQPSASAALLAKLMAGAKASVRLPAEIREILSK